MHDQILIWFHCCVRKM